MAPISVASVSPEADSFDDFYASTAPALVRQVHALTGDLAEAQDCVQGAYARAWQRWSTINVYHAPAAWVRVVACRLAISRFRRLKVGIGLLRRQGLPPTGHSMIFMTDGVKVTSFRGGLARDVNRFEAAQAESCGGKASCGVPLILVALPGRPFRAENVPTAPLASPPPSSDWLRD